jgi:hypothetical protein
MDSELVLSPWSGLRPGVMVRYPDPSRSRERWSRKGWISVMSEGRSLWLLRPREEVQGDEEEDEVWSEEGRVESQ